MYQLNLPEQTVAAALTSLSEQTDIQVLFPYDIATQHRIEPLVGSYQLQHALERLLHNTGLHGGLTDSGVITISQIGSNVETNQNGKGKRMNITTKKSLLATMVGLFAATGGLQSAYGQDGEAATAQSRIDEIIVTATKRETSLQDTALAISAIGNHQITRQGLDSFQDFARQIPGVNLTQAVKNGAEFRIRGLSSNIISIYGANVQDPVSVYIDDVSVVGAVSAILRPDLRLYDIERVEVLRGPQGTLFGSGSLGGAVRIITKKPEFNEFDGSVLTDLAATDSGSSRQRYNGMINIPLVEDKVALRAVAYYRDEEGYIDNVGRGINDEDSSEDWGGRISLKAALTDQFTAVASILHQDSQPDANSTVDPTLGENKRFTRYAEHRVSEITSYNLNLQYDFDTVSLVSATSYFDTDGSQFTDVSPFLGNIFGASETIDLDGEFISQEIRLSSTGDNRLDWLLGGFYIDRETHWGGETNLPDLATDAPGVTITGQPGRGGQGIAILLRDLETSSQELAAFGELTYHINEQWDVTGGFRYTEIETSTDNNNLTGVSNAIGLLFAPGGPVDGSVVYTQIDTHTPSDDNALTGKVSITYRPDDDQTYYFLLSNGFRVGMGNPIVGTDPNNPTAFVIPDQFESDSLWNYEFGSKLTLLDGRLTANTSVYYTPWKDIQLQGRRNTDFASFTANAGEAVATGIEVELKYLPTNNLSLDFSITRQRARITDVTAEESLITGAVDGDHLPGAPDFQIAGSAEYRWSAMEGEMYARLDAQYIGESKNGLTNTSGNGLPNPARDTNQAYENVNASIGYTSNNWWVSLYAENLSDNDDLILVQDILTTFNRYSTLRPRTFGLRASWNY